MLNVVIFTFAVYLKKTTYEYIMEKRRQQVEQLEARNAINHNDSKATASESFVGTSTIEGSMHTASTFSFQVEKISGVSRRVVPQPAADTSKHFDFKKATSAVFIETPLPKEEVRVEHVHVNYTPNYVVNRTENGFQSPRRQPTSTNSKEAVSPQQPEDVPNEFSSACNEFGAVLDVVQHHEDLENPTNLDQENAQVSSNESSTPGK